jgi:hypothetical protein
MLLANERTIDIIRGVGCSPGLVSGIKKTLRAQGLLPPKEVRQGRSSESGPGLNLSVAPPREADVSPDSLLLTDNAGHAIAADAPDTSIPPSAIEASSDLSWLRSVRDNPKVLWGDRIRAAIAASKLEGIQTEDRWSPPSGEDWQMLLRDLILSQAEEDRVALIKALAPEMRQTPDLPDRLV